MQCVVIFSTPLVFCCCFLGFLAIGPDSLSWQQSPQTCHAHNLRALWALYCGPWRLAQGHKHQTGKRGGLAPGREAAHPHPPPTIHPHACCCPLWFNQDHHSHALSVGWPLSAVLLVVWAPCGLAEKITWLCRLCAWTFQRQQFYGFGKLRCAL